MATRGPERIESVDVLRGLFAASIMVYHCLAWTFESWFAAGKGPVRIIDWLGIYGVEAFFVISAFSLFHVYRAKDFTTWPAWREFLWKRIVRIGPLYLAAVAVAVAFRFLSRGELPSTTELLMNATLTFGFIAPAKSLIIGGWSIGVELAFYAAFPLMVVASQRWKPFVAVFALASIIVSTAWQVIRVPGSTLISDPSAWSNYVALPMHLALFGLGFYAYHLWSNRTERSAKFAPVGSIAVVCLIAVLAMSSSRNQTEDVTGLVRLASLGLCGALCVFVSQLPFREGSLAGAMKFLGTVSYSVYLLHPFVYQGLKLMRIQGGFLAAGTMVLTLPLAWMVYRWLEKPSVDWGRKVAKRWASPGATLG
jgi:peptidoglycan/LPS O-acetylase OafA/YrhL